MDRIEFLKRRKNFLGGSDIGCIVGVNKYKSALDIYIDKTTDTITETINEAARFGHLLEDIVAQEYSRKTGNKVDIEKGLIIHPKYPIACANIDRWVNDKEFILECKTTCFMKGNEWGEEYTDQIPEAYLCQIAWYAAICDVPKVDIAVLIGGQTFKIYTYNRNLEFEDKLMQIGNNFWNNHIIPRIPPLPVNLSDISTLYPESNNSTIEANDDFLCKIEKLKNLKSQEKNLQEEIKGLQFEIKSFMKEHDTLIDPFGATLITWKNSYKNDKKLRPFLIKSPERIYIN